MRKIRLVIEYDGAGFHGWQRQGRRPTVQAAVERAIRRVTGRRSNVHAAGRTDAGVHAEGQVAVFHTDSTIPAERFCFALTSHLPAGVAIVRSEAVPESFNPQRDARGKRYRYVFLVRPARAALDRGRVWWLHGPVDFAAMRRAARHLVGRHDFRSFTTEAADKPDTVRTVRRLSVKRDGDRIVMEIDGDGFLYNMVRAIAGTLADVGRGRTPPDAVRDILRARDRSRAGRTAPAHGLTLVHVNYD